ncbi:MAG: adenylosuccinate synthase [bacterium]
MATEPQCRLVMGLFWGDEGKAKAIDVLGEHADIVARYGGGANAGHTVYFEGEKYVFHQVPTGLLRDGVTGVLGAGMVIDLPELINEIRGLTQRGKDVLSRIVLSPRAHLVTDLSRRIEAIGEATQEIGTTKRGIGPTYSEKASRRGLRVDDLLHEKDLNGKMTAQIEFYRPIFERAGAPVPTADEILAPLLESRKLLSQIVGDVSTYLADSLHSGKKLLIEGAQGAMLDIDWGTYPYVTSSGTSISGVAGGLGIDPRKIEQVVGMVKAFTSRVGNGPMPTELFGDEALPLRGTGQNEWDEFGATTGRPRRCGWLDGFVLSNNCKRWGVDRIFLTKLDILDGLEEIRLCSAYKLDGKVCRSYPSSSAELDSVEPVYEELDGWEKGVSTAKVFSDLPENAQYYIKRIEQLGGCPVGWVSTGPGRLDTIAR